MAAGSLNVRPYNNKELLLFPALIGDYLPLDHLSHIVDEAVDEIDLTSLYNKLSSVGNPAYHPALMTKIWFYGYATKTYSSRRIEEKLHSDVAFIYLAGMQKPDFRTISDFRKNNINELKELFVEILQICRRLGIMNMTDISIDSKAIRANASKQRNYYEEELVKERQELENAVEEYLKRANHTDQREDELYGTQCSADIPATIHTKENRIEKIRQAIKQLNEAHEELKRSGKKEINLTDKDAQLQYQGNNQIFTLGYRAQIAVDAKEQIIITSDVTNEKNDSNQLIPMVDKALKNIQESETANVLQNKQNQPIKLTADSGYCSAQNLSELNSVEYKDKIDPYIPDRSFKNKHKTRGHDTNSPFHRSQFIYNEKENCFICPAGKKLDYKRDEVEPGGRIYSLYICNECRNCQHFGTCTNNKINGRKLCVPKYQYLVDEMRNKLSKEAGKRAYDLRKITVEPVFGNMSHNLGFKEFLLRGMDKVKGEFSLMCIAHNIRKIAKFVHQEGITLKEVLRESVLSPIQDSS
jgi:transposase